RRDHPAGLEVALVAPALVVDRAEAPRPDPLDVPGVEELVREEEQDVPVFRLGPEREGGDADRLRRAVLEASTGSRGDVDDEEVAWVRQAAEEPRRLLGDRAEVADQASRVLVPLSPDREGVLDSANAEPEDAVRAALEWRVD